ncbi:pseudouridine synthase [Fennellomyces sp. T-0311]|nr:pseudouridine synthase [Fennellomyces sp. T-0311]
MASRSLRHALNGVFSVYKPSGWTSRDATDAVQNSLSEQLRIRAGITKKLKQRDRVKIGHGGTLDPLAEGVLILGVGSGCKKLHEFLHCTKYEVLAKFGQATDSYDSEGMVTHTGSTDHITKDVLLSILPQFQGEITQVPPIYSAISIQGRRAYDYARQGVPLPRPIEPRKVNILALDLLEFQRDHALFRVECSGGTYMRSLVDDIGRALGSYAHMTGLKRTRQGAVTLHECLQLVDGQGRRHLDLETVVRVLA